MGTHPIFESDFDCLTEKMTELEKKFNLLEHETKERYKKTIEEGSWTANKGFTVEEGEKDISQFVSKWALDECWLYCIDYIECVETEFGKNHHYNVKFSIPTRQKPVPLATASVFFVLTESKSGSPNSPIGVEYQVEGHHLNQSPGKLEFRQKWLYDVLKSKNIFSTELIRF